MKKTASATILLVLYYGIGMLFHYMLKGDVLSMTASSFGIIIAWPFIAIAAIVGIVIIVLILILFYMLYDDVVDRRRRKKVREGKAQPTLNDVVDEILVESAKSGLDNLKAPRPKRD